MNPQVSFREQVGSAAELYDATFVPSIAVPASQRLFELADLEPGERVLDLACGTGIAARLAASAVGSSGSVVGVDVSPDMIEVARSRPTPAGAAVEWHVADAAQLPLPSDGTDCVLCQMGVMFFNDRTAALDEVRRVLRPGGRLVLNTPGAIQPPLEVLDQALVQHISPDLGGFVRAVFSMPDPDQLAALLTDAGFGDVEAEVRPVPLDLPTPGEFLWQYLGSTPLGVFVASASEEAKDALEADVVEQWQGFAGDDGRLVLDQPVVYARGTSS
jgi:ubiquinone/menaquinone biosynthesis C-methylase UbiE